MQTTFLGTLVIMLLAAGVFDVWRFIIPNVISAVLVVAFVPAAVLVPLSEPLWSYPAAALIVFSVGLVGYAFKIMGAGDIKLLTAVALWAGLGELFSFLVLVAVAGGVLALLLIVLRRVLFMGMASFAPLHGVQLPRILVTGEAVPYGVAIAGGGIWLAFTLPYLGGVAL